MTASFLFAPKKQFEFTYIGNPNFWKELCHTYGNVSLGHEKMTGKRNLRTTILMRQIYVRENTYWEAHSVLAIPCISKNVPFSEIARL